jgi:hypothetical protein
MEARKLPTLCVKFEQWYFVPHLSRIIESFTNASGKGELCRVFIALCVFSPNALLGAQGSVGLQSVQELLQSDCESLGLISRRQRRRKKTLSDLGCERDYGAGSGRFHSHDRCPIGGLESSGSPLASSPFQIVKY